MTSSSVQSPDDIDTTYRRKNDTNYNKGQSINIVETAHPDNPMNLLTDITVAPNNVNDSDILNNRLSKLKEKIPDLNALPPERQKLRPNIEATVFEFGRRMPRGKLKVRGYFKTCLFAFITGIAINFGRIVRYLGTLEQKEAAILAVSTRNYVKEQYISLISTVNTVKDSFRTTKMQPTIFSSISLFHRTNKESIPNLSGF